MGYQTNAERMQATSFSALCEELQKSLPPDSDVQSDLRLAKRKDGQMEFKAHEAKAIADHLPSRSRSSNRADAVGLIYDALSRDVGSERAKEMMKAANVKRDVITLGQLQTLQQAWPQQMDAAIQNSSHEWQQARRVQQHSVTPKVGSGIDNVLGDSRSKWQMAGAGAGAALIVQSQQEPSGGCVIKFDTTDKAYASQDISQIGSSMTAQTRGTLPIEFADVTTIQGPLKGSLSKALQKQIKDIQSTTADTRLEEHAKKVPKLGTPDENGKEICLSKMSLVKGVPLDKLPLADRVALYKSPEFARQVGEASVLCPMFGLNDHLGPTPVREGQFKGTGSHEAPALNTGNIMINPQSGKLVMIDYSTGVTNVSMAAGNPTIGGFRGAEIALNETTKFLQAATTDGESLQSATKQMLKDCNLQDLVKGIDPRTPLSASYALMTRPSAKDSFFNIKEIALIQDMITDQDRQNFANHMLQGSIQGLEYVSHHQQEFENAYEQTAQQAVREGRLLEGERGFMTQQQMAGLKEILTDDKLQAMRHQMDELLHEHHTNVRQSRDDMSASHSPRHHRAGSIGAAITQEKPKPTHGVDANELSVAMGKLKPATFK
jgi:hypothetical protein